MGDAFGPRCDPFGAQPPSAFSCKHRIGYRIRTLRHSTVSADCALLWRADRTAGVGMSKLTTLRFYGVAYFTWAIGLVALTEYRIAAYILAALAIAYLFAADVVAAIKEAGDAE
jgi:hypothetical protein